MRDALRSRTRASQGCGCAMYREVDRFRYPCRSAAHDNAGHTGYIDLNATLLVDTALGSILIGDADNDAADRLARMV